MYAGHAGIALALKARRPAAPMALLALAAYGPDWVELALGAFLGPATGERYSHWLVGVALCAGAAWLAAAARLDRGAATAIALAWLSHWPTDFLTAYKPLLTPVHAVGLDLYMLPAADFALEALLIVAGALLYIRTQAPTPRQRRWVAAAAALLVAMQAGLDFGQAHNPYNPPWTPRLAGAAWRPQRPVVILVDVRPSLRMALALSPANLTASETWHRTASAGSSPWSA